MKIFILCPLPEEQKPINEYIRLKETKTINWTMLSKKKYTSYLRFLYQTIFIFIFLTIMLVTTPCFFLTTSCFENTLNVWNSIVSSVPYSRTRLVEIFLNINQWSLLIFLIIFCLCFFFWWELSKNLKKSYLLYEEGSWYEIQRWEKPLFLIKNDRLLNIKRIENIKKRIFYTAGGISFLSVVFNYF